MNNDLTLRPLSAQDLDAAIDLWRAATADGVPPVFGVADAVQGINGGCPSVGAFMGEALVGTAVAKVEGDRAWLLRWVVHPEHRRGGLGSQLLDEIVAAVRQTGATRLAALLPEKEVGREAFAARGFGSREGLESFELQLRRDQPGGVAADLGAQTVAEGAWDRLAGMAEVKSLIERRVVLPLANPERAATHGVQPPRAIMLFGPPGTGKTTFAKAVAGRLQWQFIELRPSALGEVRDKGRAAALRQFFDDVGQLDRTLVFIDEVEDIAAARGGDPDRHALTNELLKLIPAFREGERRLLVCATNAIADLDAALRRPGRFDYLLPVGPPDAEARAAIWTAYLRGSIGADRIDIDALVQASEGATPADIEFACRKAAQQSFEREMIEQDDQGLVTHDVLEAWRMVGPSLTRSDLREFEDDIEAHSRV